MFSLKILLSSTKQTIGVTPKVLPPETVTGNRLTSTVSAPQWTITTRFLCLLALVGACIAEVVPNVAVLPAAEALVGRQPLSPLPPLANYRRNDYSQNGEDGLLEELLRRIGVPSGGWACEFGAWDGKYMSNTWTLVERSGWRVVYIEPDADRFADLLATQAAAPEGAIVALNTAVAAGGGPSGLDAILSGTSIPADFDLLSIDVDSDDFHIWEGLTRYRPKIVVIEIMSNVLPGMRSKSNTFGFSPISC